MIMSEAGRFGAERRDTERRLNPFRSLDGRSEKRPFSGSEVELVHYVSAGTSRFEG